jgi:hypothetical protein
MEVGMKAFTRGFRGVGVGVLVVGMAVGVWGVSAGWGREKAENPGQAAQAKEEIQWTTYEDTFEHAFTLEVPQGWTVKGGLFRFGFSDERPMVDMTSPDGKINLRIGDVSIPSYAVPSQNHMREGEVYDLGAQAQLIVARYRTGPQFAILYSHVRFYGDCKNPTADSTDVGVVMPDYIRGEGTDNSGSRGQIAYHCETKDGPKVAFAAAKTGQTQGIWQAGMVSFLAPVSDVEFSKKALTHCVETFQLKPQWIEYQKQMDAQGLQYQRARQQQRMQQLAQQVQQFEQQMRAMQNQVNAFERHQQAQANQVESFTQALRGVTPTIDPMTGEAKEVWTGPNSNYWTNGVGDVVNSVNGPAGWHQLQTPNQ